MEQLSESYEGYPKISQLITGAVDPLKLNKGQKSAIWDMHHYNSDVKWMNGNTGEPRKQVFEELHYNGIGEHSRRLGPPYKQSSEAIRNNLKG